MEHKIEDFSMFLVIRYSNLSKPNQKLIGKLRYSLNPVGIDDILNGIEFLFKCYRKSIDEITIKNFEHTLSSKEIYMKHLLLRCKNLSGKNPQFFDFLLVCLYICRIAECVHSKYKCCKVLKHTADCLEATYCRYYWDYFAENDMFSGLSKFCKNLRYEWIKYEVRKFVRTVTFNVFGCAENTKEELFKNFDIGDCRQGDQKLNDMERKCLVDKPYLRPNLSENRSADFLIDRRVQSNALVCNKKDWDNVFKPVNGVPEIVCDYCRAQCFKYFDYLFFNLSYNENYCLCLRYYSDTKLK